MILNKEHSPDASGLKLLGFSLKYWYLEFEICLEFDAWNLGFHRYRERLRVIHEQGPV